MPRSTRARKLRRPTSRLGGPTRHVVTISPETRTPHPTSAWWIRLHVRPPESLSGSRAHETPCRIESRTGVIDVFKREGLMAGMGSRARKPAASNQDRASLDERRVPRRPPTVLETSNGAPSSPT